MPLLQLIIRIPEAAHNARDVVFRILSSSYDIFNYGNRVILTEFMTSTANVLIAFVFTKFVHVSQFPVTAI